MKQGQTCSPVEPSGTSAHIKRVRYGLRYFVWTQGLVQLQWMYRSYFPQGTSSYPWFGKNQFHIVCTKYLKDLTLVIQSHPRESSFAPTEDDSSSHGPSILLSILLKSAEGWCLIPGHIFMSWEYGTSLPNSNKTSHHFCCWLANLLLSMDFVPIISMKKGMYTMWHFCFCTLEEFWDTVTLKPHLWHVSVG